MHVHPNTVRYRLEQIATKTGHDPRTFTGLVDLICILELTDDGQATRALTNTGTATVVPTVGTSHASLNLAICFPSLDRC